jgi:predicted ATPase
VAEQVVTKTDGVPLFVEELIKMGLESGRLQEQAGRLKQRQLHGPLLLAWYFDVFFYEQLSWQLMDKRR